MTGFRASGASTGRRAKPERMCLSCMQAALPKESVCTCGGIIERFASGAEARRFRTLKQLEKGGQISRLVCHPRYSLVVNRKNIGTYTADFEYDVQNEQGWEHRVEDVKPFRLKKNKKVVGLRVPIIATETALRIKLFQALHDGVTVTYVE